MTGSSYGIGRALAVALGELGFNVVLIARSRDKLEEVAKEIQAFGVQTQILCYDFLSFANQPRDEPSVYDLIEKDLAEFDISLLINNVGGLPDKEMKLWGDVPWEEEERVRYLNAVPTQRMTKIVINRMKAKKAGAIINISSLASKFSLLLVPYASQKAALNTFTEKLQGEYGEFGIQFQVILSGEVSTPAIGDPPITWTTPSSETMAKACIRAFGSGTITVPYIGHAVPSIFMEALPRPIALAILKKMMPDVARRVHKVKKDIKSKSKKKLN